MKITQLSVFLENKKGRLYDVASALGGAGIDIKALIIAESGEFGVLRMVVSDPGRAVEVLKEHGLVASITDIVAVEVNDHPGGLAAVLKILDEYDINVEYMYAFVEKNTDKAVVVFRFDDLDKAIATLTKNHVRVLGKKDIQGL
ncbi:MAG TPA: ACT domain-containing protein [Candidatus Omnitrophota bacterium]|nr:ACT domain-containing protein [Candidatus Omnitrophota bacterium]HPB68283.1 ACT domain-containing protein [Candidatus Omnitrophota bacterium]HQO58589.1 ACT domain-containing protein [Candidatus Omnitrophota bacterium]